MFLVNKETGEKLCEFNGLVEDNEITYEPETEFSIDKDKNFSINNFSCSVTGTLDCIGSDLKNLLEESKDKTFKINMTGYREVMVQKRIHKKKRINNKWKNRYGYKIVQIPEEYTFNKCKLNNNGEIEVLAEM